MARIMITLVGVGHVFALSEKVKQVIRAKRPEVVCLELDSNRYQALRTRDRSGRVPIQYALLALFQKKMAEKFESEAGDEMLAAASAADEVGAKLALIDMDAQMMFARLWKRMSLKEKSNMVFGALIGLVSSKEAVEREVANYEAHDAEYISKLGEGFPTVKEVLIDDRNKYMATQLAKISESHANILAVVGDGHVPGILEALKEHEIEAVRLKDLRETEAVAEPSSSYTHSYWYR